MTDKTHVIGDEELVASLRRMSNGAERMVGVALTLAAVKVKNRARGRVPKVTRTLERSIHPDNLRSTGEVVTIDIGTDVEYARRIELGFAGTDSLGRTYNQSAKPYLRPALLESESEIQNDAARALRMLILSRGKV